MQGVQNARIGQTARRSLVDQLVPVTSALRVKLFDRLEVFTAITFVIFPRVLANRTIASIMQRGSWMGSNVVGRTIVAPVHEEFCLASRCVRIQRLPDSCRFACSEHF